MTDWPTALRLAADRKSLLVRFESGAEYRLAAEYLRVMSPSAEVQGHSAAERKTVGGKIGVGIADVQPVGNYAVRLAWNDGRGSGLYTWEFLRELATGGR